MEEPASDANTMVEKDVNVVENQPGHIIEAEDEIAPDEYPTGAQFVFILIALILSIFMVALDLVRLATFFPQTYADAARRLSSQRLSQRSPMSFTAFHR